MSENSSDLRVYTLDEAAAVLRCDPGWLQEQARKGKAPHLRLPDSWLFTGTHLAAIIAMHEVSAAVPPPAVRQLPALAWTTAEAAALLRCKPSWLEGKARRKEIPCTRLSGSYHFTDEDLAEIIRIFKERPRSQGTPGPRVSRPKDDAQSVLRARGADLTARPPRNPRGRAAHGNATGRIDLPPDGGFD